MKCGKFWSLSVSSQYWGIVLSHKPQTWRLMRRQMSLCADSTQKVTQAATLPDDTAHTKLRILVEKFCSPVDFGAVLEEGLFGASGLWSMQGNLKMWQFNVTLSWTLYFYHFEPFQKRHSCHTVWTVLTTRRVWGLVPYYEPAGFHCPDSPSQLCEMWEGLNEQVNKYFSQLDLLL